MSSLKHKVLKDFQFVTVDKKIVVLKAKTVLENYKYKTKNDSISLEKDVVDNNPEFFAPIDWKEELNTYIKQNKIPSPAILTKKLVPFIEEMFILNQEPTDPTIVHSVNFDNSDLHLREIELEAKIKKNELRESKLKEELEAVHVKESFLVEREKEVSIEQSKIDRYKEYWDKKAVELQNHHNILKELQKSLEEKEQNLLEKEQNFQNYLSIDEVRSRIQNSLDTYGSTIYPCCTSLHGHISKIF
jgi:hypothetical protein